MVLVQERSQDRTRDPAADCLRRTKEELRSLIRELEHGGDTDAYDRQERYFSHGSER